MDGGICLLYYNVTYFSYRAMWLWKLMTHQNMTHCSWRRVQTAGRWGGLCCGDHIRCTKSLRSGWERQVGRTWAQMHKMQFSKSFLVAVSPQDHLCLIVCDSVEGGAAMLSISTNWGHLRPCLIFLLIKTEVDISPCCFLKFTFVWLWDTLIKSLSMCLHLKLLSLSQVSIPALQDPLLKAVQKKFIETGIVKRCETGRINHQCPLETFHAGGSSPFLGKHPFPSLRKTVLQQRAAGTAPASPGPAAHGCDRVAEGSTHLHC